MPIEITSEITGEIILIKTFEGQTMEISIGLGLLSTTTLATRGDLYQVLSFRPALVFDFIEEYYRVSSTETTFASALTVTRASSATQVNAAGLLVTAEANVPRRAHHVWNGSAWVNRGMLVEPTAATNLLLNNATLSTQSVTVTAVPHTLHFTGTGTVTLSGAATDSLVGTGAGEQNRVNLTFTPTAGSLTLTVTGSVTFADLTATPIPYSHIPTAGATVTRAADVVTVPAANLTYPTLTETTGIELVTNGTFDTDLTGWTNSNWTWTAGQAATTGVFGTLTQFVGERTKQKLIGIDYVKTSGRVQCQFIDSTASNPTVSLGNAIDLSTLGVSPLSVIIPFGYDTIRFTTTDSAADWTIDNISVKEIESFGVSIQLEGLMTYADINTASQRYFYRWLKDGNNQLFSRLSTDGANTGEVNFWQINASTVDVIDSSPTAYSPGINVPFNMASRHGATFLNGAVDGLALTANLTPIALPDFSTTDLLLASSGGPMIISKFRMWAADLTDAGIAEASA